MKNIRNAIRSKFIKLSNELDSKLLSHVQDEVGAELETYVHDTFYNSFQVKVGDEIQDNLKFDITYSDYD